MGMPRHLIIPKGALKPAEAILDRERARREKAAQTRRRRQRCDRPATKGKLAKGTARHVLDEDEDDERQGPVAELAAKSARIASIMGNRRRLARIRAALDRIADELRRAREVKRQASLGGAEHALETRLLQEIQAARIDLAELELP